MIDNRQLSLMMCELLAAMNEIIDNSPDIRARGVAAVAVMNTSLIAAGKPPLTVEQAKQWLLENLPPRK